MAETMRAAVLEQLGGELHLRDVPLPTPGPGQVRVRVQACGVCHTDLHACEGTWRATAKVPLVPAHEAVGSIDALGPGVAVEHLGKRVGVFWLNGACGACPCCAGGDEAYCSDQRNTGYGVPGGFAEAVLVDAAFAVPIPNGLAAPHAAPLLCAGVTAYRSLRECGLTAGQRVAIVGAGGVGHLAVAYARRLGFEPWAFDVKPEALALAREMGAAETIDASDARALRRARVAGFRAALATAPAASAVRLAVDLLARRGVAMLVGIPPGEVALSAFDLVAKGLTLRGTLAGTRRDVAEALALAATTDLAPRVTTLPLDAAPQALASLRAGTATGRLVLVPG